MEKDKSQHITPELLLNKSFLKGLIYNGRFPYKVKAIVGGKEMVMCYLPPEEIDLRRDGPPTFWHEGMPVWKLQLEADKYETHHFGVNILLKKDQAKKLEILIDEIENENQASDETS